MTIRRAKHLSHLCGARSLNRFNLDPRGEPLGEPVVFHGLPRHPLRHGNHVPARRALEARQIHTAIHQHQRLAFGQIVARDPFVLIGRHPDPTFRFQNLRGKRLAVAHEVPTPWMTFQDDLTRAGIDPASLDIAPPGPMETAPARLAANEIDVAQVLEPIASGAVASGTAHIWHRFAQRGDIGYTSFYTTRAYLDGNPETCAALLAGIAPALAALAREPASRIAAELAPLFPGVPQPVLGDAVSGYQASNLWPRQTAIPPSAFVRLKAALLSGGLIARDIPHDHIIARLEAP